MNIVLPFRGEFGMKLYWQVPAVHAIPGEKVVYGEEYEEALYPSAQEFIGVQRNLDDARRNHYHRDASFVDRVQALAERRFGYHAQYLRPDQSWPRERFQPKPWVRQGVTCDVVVCPRWRRYGAEKNWPAWPDLTERLVTDGLDVFAGGVGDSSYMVPCVRAWDYERSLDATIEAMQSAKLVVATDAGLAHLAVLCGAPLLMITHGEGIVAPGPVLDPDGKTMEPHYWPVHIDRYKEANHTDSMIELLYHAWYDLPLVERAIKARCS